MHVCLILFPGFPMLAFALVRAVLDRANARAGQRLFSWQLRTVTGAPVPSDDGTPVAGAQPDWYGAQGFDLVLLCAGPDPLAALPMGLRSFLAAADAAEATLGGIDGGALILARLGFLDGREAVLPEAGRAALGPALDRVAPCDRAVSIDRRRLTAASGLAPAEALLGWIARSHGSALAAQTAEALAAGRIGDMGARMRLVRPTDPLLDRMQAVMAARIEQPMTLERVATELELSPKQLRLRCRKGLGETPAQVYLALRLDRAAQLVDETRLSVSEIARATGFASPSAFTRSYRARFGAAPRSQRRIGQSSTKGKTVSATR